MAKEQKSHSSVKVYGCCFHGFGLSWALMTLCFLIINIIVFAEPQWIGDTLRSPGVGYAGLYQLCEFVNFGATRVCDGTFQNFDTILTDAFRASTFFIGVSVLVILLCVLLFLLFICIEAYYVFIVCGILQVISFVLMFLGCVIFPSGWTHMYVRRICGDDVDKYAIGQCEMRWAYILAIIGIFVILMLAIMAFCLARKQPRRWKNRDMVKRAAKPKSGYGSDVRDGTMGSKPVKPKGYVVDVSSTLDARSLPPSYYRATPSRVGGRSGMYSSQQLYNGGGPSEMSGPQYYGHGVSTSGRAGHDGPRYRNGGAGNGTYHPEPRPRRGSF